MIDPHALRTLIEQWRNECKNFDDEVFGYGYNEAQEDCANELEALLSALPETPEPLIDNGNIFVFCDFVDVKHGRGCIRGAGHNGPHAMSASVGPQEPILLRPAPPPPSEEPK